MTDYKHSAPEEWRNLTSMGFSAYDASSHGRVRTHKYHDAATSEPYIMQPSLNRCGYPVVQVRADNGKDCVIAIHALVWCARRSSTTPSARFGSNLDDVVSVGAQSRRCRGRRHARVREAGSRGASEGPASRQSHVP